MASKYHFIITSIGEHVSYNFSKILLSLALLAVVSCKTRTFGSQQKNSFIEAYADDTVNVNCTLDYQPRADYFPQSGKIVMVNGSPPESPINNGGFEYATEMLPSDLASMCDMYGIYVNNRERIWKIEKELKTVKNDKSSSDEEISKAQKLNDRISRTFAAVYFFNQLSRRIRYYFDGSDGLNSQITQVRFVRNSTTKELLAYAKFSVSIFKQSEVVVDELAFNPKSRLLKLSQVLGEDEEKDQSEGALHSFLYNMLREWKAKKIKIAKTNAFHGSSVLYCRLGMTFDTPTLKTGDQGRMTLDVDLAFRRFQSQFEPDSTVSDPRPKVRLKRKSDLQDQNESRDSNCLGLIEESV